MRKELDEKVQENSELLNKIDEISHQLLSARRIGETYQKDVEMQGRSLKDAAKKLTTWKSRFRHVTLINTACSKK